MQEDFPHVIRIGTRDSALARVQTDVVAGRLKSLFPSVILEIVAVKTYGDKVTAKPIAELGARGVFVKELEEALLNHEVDLAVHSLKDLPGDLPEGLVLSAVLDRQDPRDVFLSSNRQRLMDLPPGSRVATSSRRRSAQLKALRSDLQFSDVRGNISTRLRKLAEGDCDAMVLAAAGLVRLKLTEHITEYLDPEIMTPAAGQGVLGVECRASDQNLIRFLAQVHSSSIGNEITAERSLLRTLGGGCSIPIGALAASRSDGSLELTGCVASLNGQLILRESISGAPNQAEQLGEALAEKLVSMGASRILEPLLRMEPNMVSPP